MSRICRNMVGNPSSSTLSSSSTYETLSVNSIPSSNEIQDLLRKLSSGSFKEVYNGLVHLRKNFLKQPDGVKKLLQNGGIKILLQFVEKPKFSDLALSILANSCLDDEVRQEVLCRDGVKSVALVFQCLASESIQNRACRALANIALSPQGCNAVHEKKVLPLVIKLLTSTKNPGCHQTALRTLRILGNTIDHRQEIISQEGVLLSADLLTSENRDVVRASVKTLTSLTQQCSVECAQQMQEGQSLPALVEMSTSTEKTIQEDALIVLVNLAGQTAIRPELGNAGAIPVFIEQIKRSENERPGTTALVTALCYCCREAINRVRIRDEQGLKILLDILRDTQKKHLHSRIIISLLAFRYDEESLDALLNLDMLSVLVEHMQLFIDENRGEHRVKAKPDCSSKNKSSGLVLSKVKDGVKNSNRESSRTKLMETKHQPIIETCTNCTHSAESKKKQNSLNNFVDINKLSDSVIKNNEPKCTEIQSEIKSSQTKGDEFELCLDSFMVVGEQRSSSANSLATDHFELVSSMNILKAEGEENDFEAIEYGKNLKEFLNHDDDGLDEEVASMTQSLQKSSSSSRVFCIHSPSYQQVQNELVLDENQSLNYIYSRDFLSPSSTLSYCYSPDRYSVDSNLSPVMYSPQHSQSSSLSPRTTSPTFQYSDSTSVCFSPKDLDVLYSPPSSPESQGSPDGSLDVSAPCYSPVCEEYFSDNEEGKEKSKDGLSCAASSELCATVLQKTDSAVSLNKSRLSCKETAAEMWKLSSKKRKRSQRSCSATISSSTHKVEKRSRHDSAAGASRQRSDQEDEKDNEYTVGGIILLIFSQLSQVEKFSPWLATSKACVQVLLNYLTSLSFPSPRAERILLRLTSNHHGFEKLVGFEVVIMLLEQLELKHDIQLCWSCQKLEMLQKKLFINLRMIAESDYGRGVLSHALLVGQLFEKIAYIIAIPHIVRRKSLLENLMIKCKGLDVLLDIIQNPDTPHFPPSVRSLSVLCCNLGVDPLVDSQGSRSSFSYAKCKYAAESSTSDVSFVLSDGTAVKANREILSRNSDYFSALLQGSFLESTKNTLFLPDVPSDALILVFHYLYNCDCPALKKGSLGTMLDTLTLCDRFLLGDLQRQLAEAILQHLTPEETCDIYYHSKQHNCIPLKDAALKFAMVGKMAHVDRCCCLAELLKCPDDVVPDIRSLIIGCFPEIKDSKDCLNS
ncbi:uncharacterized protein LOC143240459 [Tachypleus tridentatus]|uniref:uncharacterized protein LOC143240459 n=1 Tax=Tachypleus tridentatus TaxID=6853 RepID=UPI003FD3227A